MKYITELVQLFYQKPSFKLRGQKKHIWDIVPNLKAKKNELRKHSFFVRLSYTLQRIAAHSIGKKNNNFKFCDVVIKKCLVLTFAHLIF